MLLQNQEIKSKINSLWNSFWAGGIANPLTAIEQITYLLFMKRLDILDAEREKKGENSRFKGLWTPPQYRNTDEESSKAIDRATLRWESFSKIEREARLTFIRDTVFPFLKDMNGELSNFSHYMQNAVFEIRSPNLLQEATDTVNEIYELLNEEQSNFKDIQGDVYEYLLNSIATAGRNGQFRTPRHIIKMMTEMVQPQLKHKILDPACGTAGFLLGAYEYIITQEAKAAGTANITQDEDGFSRVAGDGKLTPKDRDKLANNLCGFDIDSTMVRLGLMNLMMHGIDDPRISYQDTLSKKFKEKSCYDIIMANPPFTGSVDKGDLNPELQLKTTKTELLFVENIYRLLKVDGTGCVIVPQGVLFGSSTAFKSLREILLNCCELKAVVTMPSGVFKPYAGVSTAVLLFTKKHTKNPKEPATKHVWFFNMESDGYSLDDKRQKLNNNGDLHTVIERFHARNPDIDTDREANYFMVPYQDIKEGFDLSFNSYKKTKIEEIDYPPSLHILSCLIETEVGEIDDEELQPIKGGIVSELRELWEMLG